MTSLDQTPLPTERPARPWVWPVLAVVMLASAAGYIRTGLPAFLWLCAASVAMAMPLRLRNVFRVPGRRRDALLVLVAALFVLDGAVARRERLHREADWLGWGRATSARATDEFAQRIERSAVELRAAAKAAAAATETSGALWDALDRHVAGHPERAVLRARAGRLEAWAGRLAVPFDSIPARHGVLATPFYLVLYVSEQRGDVTAVATTLLHAEHPADRLTSPLDVTVAKATGAAGFDFLPASALGDSTRVVKVDGEAVLAVDAVIPPAEVVALTMRERANVRSGLLFAMLFIAFIVAAWRREYGARVRLGAVGVATAVIAQIPLSNYSNLSRWFDPGLYYAPTLGPLTANVAELTVASALALMALFAWLRTTPLRRGRAPWVAVLLVVSGVGPFLLRDLARGIRVPASGITMSLWLAWEIPLFLAAFAVLLVGVTAGQRALGGSRGVPGWIAPLLAALSALIAPPLLEAQGRLPGWYPAPWVAAIAALALTRAPAAWRARRAFWRTAFVAACGAVILVWSAAVRQRVVLAERDVQGLSAADPYATALLQRIAADLTNSPPPTSRVELLARYAGGELADAGFPIEMTAWDSLGRATADLRVGMAAGVTFGLDQFAREARRLRQPVLRQTPAAPVAQRVLAVPHANGGVTTVVVAPRTKLVPSDPFTGLIGLSPPSSAEPPYTLQLGDPRGALGEKDSWHRMGDELHGDWVLPAGDAGTVRVHARVDLRPIEALAPRGALLVLVDLLVVAIVWGLLFAASGTARRWVRRNFRGWPRSYRLQLSLALFAFFVLPAGGFAAWSYRRLLEDDRQSRDLLVRETLRGVATSSDSVQLSEASARFETPLFLYADGLLVGTSDPVLDVLAPVGRLLPAAVVRALGDNDDLIAGKDEQVNGTLMRFGYRAAVDPNGVRLVLSAPARSDELALDRRRRDVTALVLVVTALGGLAAFWLSGIAARKFARPINTLREAALAVADGAREPMEPSTPPVEFEPVFVAFRQMAADLGASRDALEAAERRLAAVLRDVASGVVAVDAAGRITLVNPRAMALLPHGVQSGQLASVALGSPLGQRLAAFLAGTAEQEEFDVERGTGVQLHVRITRLLRGVRGAVVTLDDVSELARAQRVLAWGEMARQVAHEIKNPLTPMRLGMQHLRRARRDGRVDFDDVLEQNVDRMLAEIDRLDEIARAFSRYGMVPAEQPAPEEVDVAGILVDVVRLEQLGRGEVEWSVDGTGAAVFAMARDAELREVLLNVLENARLAGSRHVRASLVKGDGVRIVVRDDGQGIAPDVLPHIFEPHFSTRTSGSGLGLAISRRLIEGWGGTIDVASAPGEGTTVTVRLVPKASI